MRWGAPASGSDLTTSMAPERGGSINSLSKCPRDANFSGVISNRLSTTKRALGNWLRREFSLARATSSALLEADVEVGVARSLVDGIRARLVGEELSRSLSPAQQVVKAVNEELVRVLGGETLRITYASAPPTVVLLAGLQGSGKTTTAAKLARWFRQQGRNPMLVGADLQRPAAVEQLRILGEQVGV